MDSLQIPTSKDQLRLYADNLVSSLPEGKATELYVSLKYAEALIADLSKRKDVRERIMNEVATQDREFTFMGCNIKKAETGSRYDFTVCQDPEWEALMQQEREISIMRKAREEILKTRVGKQPATKMNFETGEVTVLEQVIPPVRTSESFITVTIK
jgi:hypothetical protein